MAKRWSNLRREIKLLRRHFLPDPFDPLGVYADVDLVQAHTRAFLVLSHAEIESYIEGWAKEIARAAESVWTSSRRISTPLAFLIGFLGDPIAVPESLSARGVKDSNQRLEDLISRLFQLYYKKISDNHGIKEKNVLSLFDPLGVASAAFAPTLMPNLDSLGKTRGEHAHHSARGGVISVLDPEGEYNNIQVLLTDLGVLERWLTDYKRKIR